MYTLGLDQSFTSTGFVLIHSDTHEIEACGLIRSTVSRDIYRRAIEIADGVKQIITKYNVKTVGIEGLAFGTRGDAARDLAGLQFVIIAELIRTDPELKFSVVSPKTVKKYACNNGSADKKMMYAALPEVVKNRFNDEKFLKTKGLYDVTDAYWIAKICASATI